MKRALLLVAFAATLGFVGGCDNSPRPPSALDNPSYDMTVVTPGSVNLKVATTNGNYTYIPLNTSGRVDQHIGEIMAVLNAFERAHNELDITSWSIEKQQSGYLTSPYIYGLWVNHRPRIDK